MKRLLCTAVFLTGCASQTPDQYVQSLVAACNQAGYREAREEVACITRLHNAALARQAAEADAMTRNQPRTLETVCGRPDALGAVRCTTR